jgi:peptidyl-prolyl cis-trans isomerase B (cyclophilin B)
LPARKRRRRGPATDYGQRRSKLPFLIGLLFNQKAFYLTFIILMIASMGAVGLGNFGSSGGNAPAPIFDDESSPAPTASAVQAWPEGPAPTVDGTKPYIATLDTNRGAIEIELVTDAPQAVNSFAFLAGQGFYNGTTFFYINRDYFAQAGDPTCNTEGKTTCSGVGGPGYTLPVEANSETHGQWSVVAPYVTAGESVHGSQFRILYEADPRSDGKETIFGRITDPDSRAILESLQDLQLCDVVESDQCTSTLDAESMLIINKVTVAPAQPAA